MIKYSNILLAALFILSAATQAKYDPNHFDPDNAAHWYRKAFDLYEEPNDIDLYDYISFKADLTPEIEHYLKSQKPVIDLLTKAAEIEHCDWQFDPWKEDRYSPTYLRTARQCPDLLLADARYCDNKQEPAMLTGKIENSLIIAQQIDFGESISYLGIISMRTRNYQFIQDYLNHYPDCSIEYLQAIKKLLHRDQVRKYCTNIDLLDHKVKIAKMVLSHPDKYFPSKNRAWEFLLNLEQNTVGQEFYQKNYQCYEDYAEKAKKTVALPYPQAVEKMKQIEKVYRDKWEIYTERFQGSPKDYKASQADCDYTQRFDFIYTVWTEIIYSESGSFNLRFLDFQTRLETQLNALQATVNLLIAYRQTKVIPDSLPATSPKDLFSNKPFLIIRTENGFKLKCQGENLSRNETHEYEFVLPAG